ncbi:FAD-dependent oxidoreductase [Phenylobacterium sp. LjRoot219]|uniref:oxidoreductase n=1 Tax=Phenylobacterium sp. LjRoot219 TaxID=3342283 RepID=UPI003ECD1796
MTARRDPPVHPKYPNVFSPIRLGPVEIPTRFFFAPHGSALSAGTKPSDDLVAYSAERVTGGGCGLVIVALVAHERGRTRQPSPHPPENIAAFRVMADAIHAAGGKIFGQIFYWWGGFGQWQPLSPPAPSLGPSTRQFGYSDRTVSTHAMGKDEIAAMHAAVRRSAGHLREAGFDGVMLHGSHAGLIEQFLSPYFNQRTDEYGGNLENRMRFLVESLQAAREGAGPDLAVGMRFNCDELLPGGYGVETAREVVGEICARGLVDYIDLDVGVEPQQFHHGMPTSFVAPQPYRPFVEQVRQAAGATPVLSVLGRITSMADAEAAIAAGVCDVVGAARQLIAEPEFVKNAREGREDRSRTCVACNWCTAAGGDGAQGCIVNPASYRERLWGVASFAPAARPSRVVIIGGGPGGLEAARVSAIKGHKVTLFEARERLGGALALWADLPGRETYRQAVDWWAGEVARLGVDVRLGAAADAAAVLAEQPDAVIVATGARYSPGGRSITFDADLPGSDRPFVYRPEEILLGGARPSGRVVLVDGEGLHASAGIAELLALGGADVTYVTAGFSPLSPRLVDSFEARFIVQRLKAAGVRFAPTTWIRSIGEGAVTLYDVHTGEERIEPVDAVVLSTGRVPLDGLARELEGRVPQLFTIGDALAARPLATAPYEGQKFARLIGEPGAPSTVCDAFFRPDEPELTPYPADVLRARA